MKTIFTFLIIFIGIQNSFCAPVAKKRTLPVKKIKKRKEIIIPLQRRADGILLFYRDVLISSSVAFRFFTFGLRRRSARYDLGDTMNPFSRWPRTLSLLN
ncbi:MAG: hypothetical protein COW00_01885 [Bdellovibrio sp. CG12_big_fil_rev_8_21_14_0_65_39_13]|nr:MAG: hypothetical protein COW78_15805 [Bdellovibrio sp. CG22_combo_CG10-13_8_21_14_all_39_27]PIQ62328.1 MAG: hypothetical protein COW00_01885 [Bdellovibrio sp. CG12_big_fil_rev_8_21_14_0_65_39_13]PIR35219.1 MAG: hypothetical protein COV37_09710 [Bdellovibrio sp. CG11_big_fil_rev_8_21_14_0_20_39_38]